MPDVKFLHTGMKNGEMEWTPVHSSQHVTLSGIVVQIYSIDLPCDEHGSVWECREYAARNPYDLDARDDTQYARHPIRMWRYGMVSRSSEREPLEWRSWYSYLDCLEAARRDMAQPGVCDAEATA